MLDLSDILVVTLEQAVAAPYCSCRLADAGARVIKIEREEGDFARGYDSVVHGESAYFVWLNRGKESLVLNIKDEQDAALLHRVLAQADVFIQNLAPGAAERSGFGSEALRECNASQGSLRLLVRRMHRVGSVFRSAISPAGHRPTPQFWRR